MIVVWCGGLNLVVDVVTNENRKHGLLVSVISNQDMDNSAWYDSQLLGYHHVLYSQILEFW